MSKIKDFTDNDFEFLDWAIDTTIEKYIEQGGDKNKMITRDAIDCFYNTMLYEHGRRYVRKYVNNYKYDSRRIKQPVSQYYTSY